jgi:hypothetical protein
MKENLKPKTKMRIIFTNYSNQKPTYTVSEITIKLLNTVLKNLKDER